MPPPWLLFLALLFFSVHSAPIPSKEPVLFPVKSVESSPLHLNGSDVDPDPSEGSGEVLLLIPPDSSLLPLLPPSDEDDSVNRVEPISTETPASESTMLSDLIKLPLDKWWCGNNTVSRGLAHVIAKMDNDIAGINHCCKIHDHEYDEARTFEEVHKADTNFDVCLARETSLYRNYVVRPLYNAAINVNYALERFKFIFKSTFLGGDGFIDLK